MPNPYPAGSNPHAEYGIWQNGLARGGGELDFLRELHSPGNLRAIRAAITAQSPAATITRVSSIWLDKYPMCQPTLRSGASMARRELGDLAVIVRSTASGVLRKRMWILQGKLYSPNWQSHGSSAKEIELYEQCPEFDLFSSQNPKARLLGTFDLQGVSGFGPPPYTGPIPFWSYLHFAHGSAVPGGGLSYICHEWPSSGPPWDRASYIDGLVDMSLQIGNGTSAKGADVDRYTSYPEWRRLYLTLWRYAGTKTTTRLPGGSWRNAALMTSELLGPILYRDADGREVASTGFFESPPRNWSRHLVDRLARFADTVREDDRQGFVPPPGEIDPPDGNDRPEGGEGGFTFLVIDQFSSDDSFSRD